MAFISIPSADIAVGKPVKQSLMANIKDNFDDLNTRITSAIEAIVPNGSFEVDSDSDGIPDNWSRSLFTGGSGAFDTTTPAHGAKAYKFTSPGGSGNGGGYLTSDYILCSEYVYLTVRFLLKSSVADIRNIVRILWYTSAKAACATPSTDIYDAASGNPTSWTEYIRGVLPPTTARYFKIRLIGADSSDVTAGTAYFDGISVETNEQDVIIGTGSGSLAVSDFISNIAFGGAQKATTCSSAASGNYDSISWAERDVAGNTSYAVALRQSTTAKLTVTLSLPHGIFTVFAMGHFLNGNNSDSGGTARLTVMAIRQA
jgi:hypothetical protein